MEKTGKGIIREYMSRCRNPFVVALFPLVILPFLFTSDSTPGKILLVLKVIYTILLGFVYGIRISKGYTVLFIITIASTVVTVLTRGGVGIACLFAILLFALFTFSQIQVDEKLLSTIYFLNSIFCYIIYVYTVYQPFVMFYNSTNSIITVPWFINHYARLNSNTCGILGLAGFFYFVASSENIKTNRRKKVTFCILVYILTIILVLLTRCRSALLALLLFPFVWFANQRGHFRKWVYYVYVGGILIFALIMLLIIDDNKYDNIDEASLFYKSFLSGRTKIWRCAVEGFAQSWLWGQGNNYLFANVNTTSAHNVLLGILVTLGIIPALSYVWILMIPGKVFSYQTKRDHFTVAQICFLSSLVISIFECTLTDSCLNFLFLPLLLMPKLSNR